MLRFSVHGGRVHLLFFEEGLVHIFSYPPPEYFATYDSPVYSCLVMPYSYNPSSAPCQPDGQVQAQGRFVGVPRMLHSPAWRLHPMPGMWNRKAWTRRRGKINTHTARMYLPWWMFFKRLSSSKFLLKLSKVFRS